MEENIEEGFGTSSYLKLDEIRQLYYNRSVMLSFSNDHHLNDANDGNMPSGFVSYRVDDLIGRQVVVSDFYAHVYRTNNVNYLDRRKYSSSDLERDLDKIIGMNEFKETVIIDAINLIENLRGLSPFYKIWKVTDYISDSKGLYKKEYWRRILRKLGYDGVKDVNDFLSKKSLAKADLIFYTISVTQVDIVPIQKYRKDPRRRITDRVDFLVTKWATRRNGISKIKFKNRKKYASAGLSGTIELLKSLTVD